MRAAVMNIAKRDIAAACARYSGLTRLLGLVPGRPVLAVLNYHRIGNASECPYDSGVFSATCNELDDQVGFLKKRFRVVGLAEAIEIAETQKLRGPAVLLTFDDGYLDNYQSALPILAAHGVPAVFFLPTAFIGTNRIPWWDAIAFAIKRSRHPRFRLSYPAPQEFDLEAEGVTRAVRTALSLYTSPANLDGERFLGALEEACGVARPDGAERCFMSWEEAAAMAQRGMALGSHSHSHEILSKLSPSRQIDELTASKLTIETKTGVPVTAVAYPVGLPESFSPATLAAARTAGYRAGFTFYGGFNLAGSMERYSLRRVSVSNATPARFRLQTTLAAATGRYWF